MKQLHYRILLLMLFLLGMVQAPLFGQQYYESEFYVGGKGGATMSSGRFAPTVSQTSLLSGTGGVMVRYIEEKYFGFQVELNFVQHGWSEDFSDEPENYQFSRRLNYLELPFLTHIFFGKQTFRGFFNLGPQIGIYLGDTYSSNFDIENPPSFITPDRPTEQLKLPVATAIDYGLCGALGCEFLTRKSSYFIEARYYFGLADMFANRTKDTFSASSTQIISLSVGYLFNINRR